MKQLGPCQVHPDRQAVRIVRLRNRSEPPRKGTHSPKTLYELCDECADETYEQMRFAGETKLALLRMEVREQQADMSQDPRRL